MRKHFIVLLCLLLTGFAAKADITKAERDSIMARIEAMPMDSARIAYALEQRRTYKHTQFARDFIDRLYADACTLHHKDAQMLALSGYVVLEARDFDSTRVKNALNQLREKAYAYKLYDYYFKTAGYCLTLMSSNGDMEQAIDETRRLKAEAIALKSDVGMVCAQMALFAAYKYTKDEAKMLKTLQEVLAYPNIDDKNLLNIYLELSLVLSKQNKHQETLDCLDKHKALTLKVMREDPNNRPDIKNRLLRIEAQYIETYMKMGDYAKARIALDRADLLYNENNSALIIALYQRAKATYYAHTKDWTRCFAAIDEGIKNVYPVHFLLKQGMLAKKAGFLADANRLTESIALYQEVIRTTEERNNNIIERQKEAIYNNYRWERAMVEHAENAYVISLILGVFFALIAAVVLFFVVRLLVVYRHMVVAKEEIRKAGDMARSADLLKEVFFKNIVKEIKEPVSVIKKGEEALAVDPEGDVLPQIEALQKTVKQLAKVVDAVQELSQLETGTLTFETKQQNVVLICYEAIKQIGQQSGPETYIQFVSDVDFQKISIDGERLVRTLYSALFVPEERREDYKLIFTLKYSEDSQSIEMDILGTPLANPEFSGQEQVLQNEINRAFITAFGGTYELTESKLRPRLLISIPHHDL